MTKRNIYILSGPVRSGKTTALQNWVKTVHAGGILCPEPQGLRMMYDLQKQTLFEFETKEDMPVSDELVSVGRFHFHAKSLVKAREIIIRDMKSQLDVVLIDELGKLEMKGQGLEPAISEALAIFRSTAGSPSLLIVIRDYLLEEAIAKFKLEDAECLSPEQLNKLVF